MSDPVRSNEGTKPVLVIERGPVGMLQYLRDLRHHRDLIRVLAVREIKLRYRQTALGVLWVVLQPLLAAGVLSFVFGRVAQLDTDGVPGFLFTFGSMLYWTAFSSSISRASVSLISNATLVSKVFFPRILLPTSAVLAIVLDFLIGFVLFLVLAAGYDWYPDARVLLLPVWLAIALMLAQGIGSLLATVAVRFRDIPLIAPVILQVLLFASPVAYSLRVVPAQYLTLYRLNPMVGLLEAFRWSALGTPGPPVSVLGYSIVAALVAYCIGTYVLVRSERGFADVI